MDTWTGMDLLLAYAFGFLSGIGAAAIVVARFWLEKKSSSSDQ